MLKIVRLRGASCERLKQISKTAFCKPTGSLFKPHGRSFADLSVRVDERTTPFVSGVEASSLSKENHSSCCLHEVNCIKVSHYHFSTRHRPFTFTNRLLGHPIFVRHFGLITLQPNGKHVRLFSSAPKTKPKADKEDEGSLEVDRKLKILKEELEAVEHETERIEAEKKTALELKKRPLREKVWKELVHYYHGFKLFFIDLKVSTRLLWQLIRGGMLSRQEQQQLVRSAADMFRMVPFLVFIVVPFMEFLLPFYLKLFPGALPSTFQEKSQETVKFRQQLNVKMEMAKFLQATVEELSIERKKKGAADTKIAEFSQFMRTMRHGDGYVSNLQLLKYSKLFEDELTLDNLSESTLRALCRIVGITPIGTANILRFQLSMRLNELKRDDRMIHKEGVENMSIGDLQAACRARGMRALGVSEERLRHQLSQWLELSFNEKVPPSLLLLSRTLFLPEEVPFNERLKALLPTLPGHLSDEVKLKISEVEGAAQLDYKSKFQLVKSIEEMLKREKENRKAMLQAATKIEAQSEVAKTHDSSPDHTDSVGISAKPKNGSSGQMNCVKEQTIGDMMNNHIAMQAKDHKKNGHI